MSVRSIPCEIGVGLILIPNSNASCQNVVLVQVSTSDDAQGKTGVITWSGCPQAFLTFDPTGRQVISYTLTSQDPAAVASVENIIRVL